MRRDRTRLSFRPSLYTRDAGDDGRREGGVLEGALLADATPGSPRERTLADADPGSDRSRASHAPNTATRHSQDSPNMMGGGVRAHARPDWRTPRRVALLVVVGGGEISAWKRDGMLPAVIGVPARDVSLASASRARGRERSLRRPLAR